MATQTALTEAEYLRASFEGSEPDFVDGALIERALPNNFHSSAQIELGHWFRLREERGLYARPELRLRVRPGRYRIADLAVYRERPTEAIPSAIPFIVIEIISPDDRWEETLSKLEDYASWGVSHVWLVDPGLQALYVYANRSVHAVASFELPEFAEIIPAAAILR